MFNKSKLNVCHGKIQIGLYFNTLLDFNRVDINRSCNSKPQCCINFNLKRYGSPITQLQKKNFEKKK